MQAMSLGIRDAWKYSWQGSEDHRAVRFAHGEYVSISAFLYEIGPEAIQIRLLSGSKEGIAELYWRPLGSDGGCSLVHGRWWTWRSHPEGAGHQHQLFLVG